MSKRVILSIAALLAVFVAGPATAAVGAEPKIELTSIMGRWYEVARVPNQLQHGCTGGASEWTRTRDGFSVVQSCHKGAPDGPLAEWRAQARVADPSNTRFRMSFFGGMITQDYQVLDHRPAEGWLLLSTRDGKYLWLMSQKPVLPAAIKAEAIARIRQLGFDPGRLEFPLPARS